MAKKFVRGITDVKTINNQDFDTNNVNDLLSDGQYNYIHRKKGKNEEYHNLTDNIKTISSDNTDLLSVTNNNKTTNTATLHPKHDAQKEQVLESTRNTVTIKHGTNGTPEKTTVDTNPQKVLEHENLLTDYGISKNTSGNTTKLGLEYTKVDDGFDLNTFKNGRVRSEKFLNSPLADTYFFVSAFTGANITIQEAVKLYDTNTKYVRSCDNNVWGEWREQVGDKSVIDSLLAQKQDTLVAGDGITIQGQTISASGGGAQKQNTENYYICLEDVAGTVTLTKLDNDIVLPNQTVKGVLEYSFYVCFDELDSQDYEKYIQGDIKNITENTGGYGIYTDVANPSLFSAVYWTYMINSNTSYYYENAGVNVVYNGSDFYMFANREKVPLGKIINLTGKVPLVVLPQGGEPGGGGGGA